MRHETGAGASASAASMQNGSPLVAVRHVSKQFSNGTLAVRDVELDLYGGEFVSLLGPSGCGNPPCCG